MRIKVGNTTSEDREVVELDGGALALVDSPVGTVRVLIGSGSFPVYQPSGDRTGVTDAAQIQTYISTYGGVQLGYAPAASPYWVNATVTLGDWQRIVGMGRGLTVIKLANSSNCNVIANVDQTVAGNTGCAVVGVTIDGNKAHQTNGATRQAIAFELVAQTLVADVEAHDCANSATSGVAAVVLNGHLNNVFSRRNVVNGLWVHDNGDEGFKITSGCREAQITNVHAWNNGGHGIQLDASECQASNLHTYGNTGDGIYISNVFGCSFANLTATSNAMHGIEVYGLVDDVGANWQAHNNSTGAANTYDDIHFTDDGLNTYGVSTESTITGVSAGPKSLFAGASQERYAIYAADGCTGTVSVKEAALTTGSTGATRMPAASTGFRVFGYGDTKSRPELSGTAEGVIAQTFPRGEFNQNNALTSQVVRYGLVGLKAGDVVSSVSFHVEVAPGTPANLTNLKVGLFTTAGVQKAVSADTPAAGQATGTATVAFTAAYTVSADGGYYLALWAKGTSMPSLAAGTTHTVSPAAVGAGALPIGSQAGQADMPSPAVISAAGTALWLACS